MSYSRVNWKDFPDTSTPVDAANLNQMDIGIAAAATIATTLDSFAVPAANVAFNAKKITGLANGTASTDAAAFGQIPTVLQPTDPGTNKVWGSTGSGTSVGVLPPGYEIGYDQITSPVSVNSSTEATPTTIITCASHTFDGAAVMLEFFCPYAMPATGATSQLLVNLFESTTNLGRIAAITDGVNAQTLIGRIRFTPSAAAHTYLIAGWQGGGTATVGAGAGGSAAYAPAFARFTKV